MGSTARTGSTALVAQKNAAAAQLPGGHSIIGEIIEILVREAAEELLTPDHNPNRPGKNETYTAGEHDYKYHTDKKGRIDHVHADQLKLKKHQGRLKNKSNTPDKIPGWDEAGHLIADRFGGSPKLDNLLSQAKSLNHGAWYDMEEDWAKVLDPPRDKDGHKPPKGQVINLDIQVIYEDGDTRRPQKYIVSYTVIDGRGHRYDESGRVFDNPKPPRK